MSTWLELFHLRGYYDSEPIHISLEGDGAISQINWSAAAPADSQVMVMTSLSFDGGYDWTEWRQAENGSSIPDLPLYSPLHHVYLRYRVFLSTMNQQTPPVFGEIHFELEPIIVFDNKGDAECEPEIWITKTGAGDLSLMNLSDRNKEFKFTNLNHNETVYVNSEREYIETDLPHVYRYSQFNDHYLKVPQGKNILRVKGNAKIQFRYQFKLI